MALEYKFQLVSKELIQFCIERALLFQYEFFGSKCLHILCIENQTLKTAQYKLAKIVSPALLSVMIFFLTSACQNRPITNFYQIELVLENTPNPLVPSLSIVGKNKPSTSGPHQLELFVLHFYFASSGKKNTLLIAYADCLYYERWKRNRLLEVYFSLSPIDPLIAATTPTLKHLFASQVLNDCFVSTACR